jgi:hypothetical protein
MNRPVLLLLSCILAVTAGFTPANTVDVSRQRRQPTALAAVSRRHVLTSALVTLVVPTAATAAAETPEAIAPEAIAIEMKTFVDPLGLFSIRTPQGFFTLRRTAKGDLPDEKTGKGRRGSSIFTAGNMGKAEVISVERYVRGAILSSHVRTFFLQSCY